MTGSSKPSTTRPSSASAPASLNNIKRLMREMEDRHDKFLDKALDKLQGTVFETFSKFNERLSSLENRHNQNQQPIHPKDLPPGMPPLPKLYTRNLPLSTLTQHDRYLGSALAAHADARNPRPPPSSSFPSAPHSSLPPAARLRGGAAGSATVGDDGERGSGDPVAYREAALKVEDVGTFEGKDVEHYIRTLEIISDIYGERRLLMILPRCMRSVAKEWFISIPADDRHLTRSLEGWTYLLHDGFGEDLRRSKERAESRVFKPWQESVEEFFYDKAAMRKRAKPHVTELELMREVWKGLSPHATKLMVVSWKQYNQKEFRTNSSNATTWSSCPDDALGSGVGTATAMTEEKIGLASAHGTGDRNPGPGGPGVMTNLMRVEARGRTIASEIVEARGRTIASWIVGPAAAMTGGMIDGASGVTLPTGGTMTGTIGTGGVTVETTVTTLSVKTGASTCLLPRTRRSTRMHLRLTTMGLRLLIKRT